MAGLFQQNEVENILKPWLNGQQAVNGVAQNIINTNPQAAQAYYQAVANKTGNSQKYSNPVTVQSYAGKSGGIGSQDQYLLSNGQKATYQDIIRQASQGTVSGRDAAVGAMAGQNYSYNKSNPNQLIGYSYSGQQQTANPQQQPAPQAATSTPTAKPQTYSEPRYLSEQVAKYLGYSGEFGAGGATSYLQANPNAQSKYNNIYNALNMSGNNSVAPLEDIQYAAQAFGYEPKAQQVDPYQGFLDQVTSLLSQAYGQPATQQTTAPSKVNYTRPDLPMLPQSLQYLQDMTDLQRRSNIAGEGLYGAGTDRDITNYYLDMLQRGVIGEDGSIGDVSLLPIETQYLQSLGIDYGTGQDFLDSVARYYALLGQ